MVLHLARISTSVLISVSISLHISGDFVRQCFWHKHIYIYIDVCFPVLHITLRIPCARARARVKEERGRGSLF